MMRGWPLALFLLPATLAGCPALLSDWTIADGPTDDASADAGDHDANGGSSSKPSSSSDASIDADADSTPEDATGREASSEDSESGSTELGLDSSPPSDSAPTDASLCDGGPVYLHHVGLDGLTWQDCVPTGTYNSMQALAACEAYASQFSPSCIVYCSLPAGTCEYSSEFESSTPSCDNGGNMEQVVSWTYSGQTEATGTGHVAIASNATATGGCPSALDPSWD